jgi:hypothetical protein
MFALELLEIPGDRLLLLPNYDYASKILCSLQAVFLWSRAQDFAFLQGCPGVVIYCPSLALTGPPSAAWV